MSWAGTSHCRFLSGAVTVACRHSWQLHIGDSSGLPAFICYLKQGMAKEWWHCFLARCKEAGKEKQQNILTVG